MTATLETTAAVARVNGVALHAPAEILAPDVLRQRACTELLRQAALREGLLADGDAPTTDGVASETASAAIDALLERALRIPEPTEDDCRRHFAARAQTFGRGERVRVRHILFAVTPGVDVVALRKRAEGTLLDVRCRDRAASDGFAATARTLSNCPSGAEGGDLGWLVRDDCAPEFAQEIFAKSEVGVLPRLVHSRFGLHVVEVLERAPCGVPEFAAVRAAVRAEMQRYAFVTALRQYLSVLAGAAQLKGVDIDGADTPLVQ